MRCKNGSRKGRDGKCHRKIFSSPRRRYLRGGQNGIDINGNRFDVDIVGGQQDYVQVSYQLLGNGHDQRQADLFDLIENYRIQHDLPQPYLRPYLNLNLGLLANVAQRQGFMVSFIGQGPQHALALQNIFFNYLEDDEDIID